MKTSNLQLPKSPTLTDFQVYIDKMVRERGFKNTLSDRFMLFLEECGELAKAAKKLVKSTDENKESLRKEAAFEVADVFIFLLDICNTLGIDLEKAFREKEEINKQRSW